MTDNELISRMEELESRLMHQEAAIEELTRTLLSQERQLAEQATAIRQLESQLTALKPRNIALSADEKPPPHY
ncbi:MAG: SlyX family protein [Gammaproteobacteria bacterium]|jgi:SlyX protein